MRFHNKQKLKQVFKKITGVKAYCETVLGLTILKGTAIDEKVKKTYVAFLHTGEENLHELELEDLLYIRLKIDYQNK